MKHQYNIISLIICHFGIINIINAQPQLAISTPNNIKLVTSERYYTTNYYLETHNDGIPNNGANFTLDIFRLPITTATPVKVHIFEVGVFFSNAAVVASCTTNANGSLRITGIDPFALNLSGVYEVRVTTPNNTLIANITGYYLFFEKTKTVTISGAPVSFKIHYTDAFFKQTSRSDAVIQSTFLNELETAIKESWQKEVIDFDLGMPVTNNNYDIYLHCNYDLAGSWPYFHKSDNVPVRTDPFDTEPFKNTFIDTKLYKAMNTNVITQQELLYNVFSHEFYHSIQWSHMSFSGMNIPAGSSDQLEVEKRKWLIEGQAVALQTVFMQYYLNSGKNVDFLISETDGSYEVYCIFLIQHALGNISPFPYKKLHEMSYEYAMFWRHMYERVLDETASDKDKLSIFKETCIAYNAVNSSVLLDIKTFMDDKILNNHTLYSSYREALVNFAENVYFHDNKWKKPDGTKLNYWDDPNGNNFYYAISNAFYTPPTEKTVPTTNIVPDFPGNIPVSFGFRPHVYNFTNAGRYQINFISDADADNIIETLSAKAYIIENDVILYSKPFALAANGTGFLDDICIKSPNQKLVILVTRYDTDEATVNEDYKITGTYIAAPVAAFDAAVDYSVSPLTVKFTDRSTGALANWNWSFGDGGNSVVQNPSHEYIRSGKHNVSLIADNCATPNTLTRNNLVSVLPPYITNVEFSQSGTKIYEYKRTYNSSTNKFEFSGSGSYAVPDKDLIIKVTTSLPLLSLTLKNSDEKSTEIYSKILAKTLNTDTKVWTYSIPANSGKIAPRINTFSLIGNDYTNSQLINVRIPASVPVFINNTGTGASQPAVTTGIDNNYVIYVKSTNANSELITHNLIINCDNDEYRVIVTNNDTKSYTVNFGDGSTIKTLAPNSFIDYQFSKTATEYVITVYDNNAEVKVFKGYFVN